jgi:phage antirepressor YoqD-like protein
MNEISVNAKTMSSREIADLTGSAHEAVKKSARRLEAAEILTSPLAESVYKVRGKSYQEFNFNKRDSLVLVARLSPEFTAVIIDRWQELESAVRKPAVLPSNYIEALQALIESEQGKAAAKEQLELAAPKVAFVDRYVESTGNKGFRQVAKLLGVKEPAFRKFLSDNKIMYQLGGEWAAYQNHIDAGRFHTSTGENNEHAYNTAKFTPKGVTWICELIEGEK